MKLPNPEKAYIDMEKLAGYVLNPDHDSGKHKARVFEAALGLTAADAPFLRDVLLEIAQTHDAIEEMPNPYGRRYVKDLELETASGKALVRSAWIVRQQEDFARLTSCYVI